MAFWVYLALFVVSFLLNELFRPKPNVENARPAGLGDFQVPTATEGRVVPVIWGRVLIKGPNVIWYGDLVQSPIREKIKTGLFSKDKVTTGFRYFLGMQFALCRGPIDNLVSIYVDEEQVFSTPTASGAFSIDAPLLFGGEGEGTTNGGGLVGSATLFPGTETQAVSSYLSAFQSPQPAYRGTTYIAWERGYIGNSSNVRPWAFEVERYPNGLAVTNAGEEKVNNAANPMCVLYEILTNDDWGLNISPSKIDVASLRVSATTLAGEGNGFAFIWDQNRDIADIITEVERQTDGSLIVNPTTGLYDFKLIRDDYTLGLLPTLDETNIVKMKSMSRVAWDETQNVVRVQFADPRKFYNDGFALAQDSANISIVGALNISSIAFPGCKDPALATSLAWRELRQLSYPIAKFSIDVNRTEYAVFPGEVRRLTWSAFGITDLPIRITKVNYGRIDSGVIQVEAMQDIFATEAGAFSPPQDTSWTQPAQTPVAFGTNDQVILDAPYVMVKLSALPDNFPRVFSLARSPGDPNIFYDLRTRESVSSNGQSGAYISQGGPLTPDLGRAGFLRSALVGYDNALPVKGTEDIVLDYYSGDSLDDLIGESFTATDINDFGLGIAVIEPGTANEEWVVCQSLVDNGVGIELRDCYRGALDSSIKAHAANARVWLVWAGGQWISDDVFTPNYYVKAKLIPRTATEELAESSATDTAEIRIASEERFARPLIPDELKIHGARYPTSASADSDADPDTGGIQPGLRFTYDRKQWRTTGALNSVLGLDENGATFTGSPSTEDNLRYYWWLYDLETTPSPTGRGDAVLSGNTDASSSNGAFFVLRDDIVAATVGNIVPTDMRIEIEARHSPPDMPVAADTPSLEVLVFDFGVTSVLQ